MKPIRIVTAYFDIGRAHFEGYERDSETYFAYFRFWARIRNDMLVYCAPEHAERVLSIRAAFGLAERTEIVTVPDLFAIEPELYRKMQQAADDPGFQSFRFYRAPENGAPYSYVTMLKAWCLADAAARVQDDCMLAWVDFGINHGGVTYAKSEEFDFLWEYEFPEKITAFCHADPATVSLIDTLQYMMPYFDGSVVVLPKALAPHYWESVRGAMEALVRLGCVDDDQMLLLIAYKYEPELFDIRLEKAWYSAFSLCSHRAFTLVRRPEASSDGKSARIMARLAQNPQHPFVRRIYDKLIQYYYPEPDQNQSSSTGGTI